jgi:nucleotide-binding universal stress UspA family protein
MVLGNGVDCGLAVAIEQCASTSSPFRRSKVMKSYRIVVGMDLEVEGDVALTEALVLASAVPNSEIHPVYAIAGDPAVQMKALDAMARHLTEAMEALRKRVEDVATNLGALQRTRLHVRFGNAAEVIHQVAVDCDADLIVVGTHGRNYAERLLLGSVSSALLKIARLPVLVARIKDFGGLEKTLVPDAPQPGEELHRDRVMSDVIQVGRRNSHISGLI